MTQRGRQFEHLQQQTLERLRARIPVGCPLTVERLPAYGLRPIGGFRVTGPGCEQVGRFQVVAAFIDGYRSAWEEMGAK